MPVDHAPSPTARAPLAGTRSTLEAPSDTPALDSAAARGSSSNVDTDELAWHLIARAKLSPRDEA
ncbi:hypothetical protein [Subtercola boreus]|uniref:Uncharacterized protein n=1 Tax=Subtercola boreus TaxID=120213 RepID=A0A3E0WAU7_9MICO|nr:hypothetical protein [Subtercola boreus]RFA20008.1 hypothetical protein B7R24_10510 [Subtercola boreus]RFA20137.1 hypothetical protein B7R23_10450 [Subtercola boreus]RFA26464.1 hypothetical protein B7R25_10575 [Subtercola boreus]